MAQDDPFTSYWRADDEDAYYQNGIKNLKSRARREFYRGNERLSEQHREYLQSLVDKFPLHNHIYGMKTTFQALIIL